MAKLKTIKTKTHERKIYSVSELNSRARQTLEGQFFSVWVEAEMSNLTMAHSGHWYFTLKDDKGQISCAMFRGNNVRTAVKPVNGIKVLVRGKVSLYEPRGNYQLIVDHMEMAGIGDLLQQFEQLKTKLQSEGLFDASNKRQITNYNKRLGVITSATGAAIHDVISTIERRFPLQELIIYPSLVQGKEAVQSIRNQLAKANERDEVDVILLVRGGGSIEDLWSFNDEGLARDIAASKIPVVSGVGHEVDVTIADYVADLRAATPTAAAESTTPDQRELLSDIKAQKQWLISTINDHIYRLSQMLDWIEKRLTKPSTLISHHSQQLAITSNRLISAFKERIHKQSKQLQHFRIKLQQHEPLRRIQLTRSESHRQQQRLQYLMREKIQLSKAAMVNQLVQLDNLSPLKVLARGYSVTQLPDGTVIHQASEVKTGDTIVSKLHKGRVESQVIKTDES